MAGISCSTYSSSTLQNNDMIQCILTSPAACRLGDKANSGIITMTVNSALTPAVSVSARDTAVCAGDSAVFTAHPVNQGSAPVYQWKNNGVITGGNSPTYAINGLMKNSTVTVMLKSNALCARPDTATSTPVAINVYPIPGISILGDTVVVAGAKGIFTVTTSNSGPDLQYQWQDSTTLHSWQNISGTAGDTINYEPAASGDKIRCVCKTHAGCTATSNSIAMRINTPVIPPASVDAYRWYPNPVRSTIYIEDQVIPADRQKSLLMCQPL
jgi:hypothetical protein